ncbi:hypothetical protein SAMN04487885_106113 [Clostridium cadaveris]|uniref:Capsid protein n=1 Tax=Clostridium cadaveris TaxID=1529 RepID=A0A1I2KSG3_9CLOT|nr:hypothetical protein [Clostridium cadaveris]SFF68051.1 hypothetical protein SAMN04487885_106113 [Clostridium cadaveris]
MAIDYAAKYSGAVDERFKEVSKSGLCVNDDYDFTGGKSVKIYNINTATMNDYNRTKTDGSRYGTVENLEATTEEMILTKDRSFTFVIDKMDKDETAQALESGKALDRQIREVIVPEIDTYRFAKMVSLAGTKATAIEITKENVFGLVTDATEKLDDLEIPQDGRFMVTTPATYKVLKQSKDIVLETEIGQEMRLKGVIAMLDGMYIIKVPSSRLPANTGFIVGHSVAITSPIKLAEYKIHNDAPGYSGDLVEGRIYYDCFIPKNKKSAIYYQPITPKA